MKKELELYIHIPFCIRKCAYCDFTSQAWGEKVRRSYFGALAGEIRSVVSERGQKEETVVSCFFGGGTPSVAEPEEICRILELLRSRFAFAPDCEITLEANPGTLTKEKLLTYKRAGINRISLGCQAVQDRLLSRIGRIHTFAQVEESVALIRACGFTNLNLDLMSGLPDQSLADYEESLRTICRLAPEHISAYSLILEEGTPLFEEKDPLNLPDEETERKMYEETSEILAEYGYAQYEISNYAREGFACRHNIGYWERRNYLGFGLSAASLDGTLRRTNTDQMEVYLEHFGEPDRIRVEERVLSLKEQMEETMFLGLRMNRGVSRRDFLQTFGISMEEIYGDVILHYKKLGLLTDSGDGDRLRLTREGINVSNVVMADFLL